MTKIAAGSSIAGFDFICVGDTGSPPGYDLEGCRFISLDEQHGAGFVLADELPQAHYSRKNLGYLFAIEGGARHIIETDDDNLPLSSFWTRRDQVISGRCVGGREWVNAYSYFTDEKVWPRGFPLQQVGSSRRAEGVIEMDSAAQCPIQQGLANGDPDVDAVYRLTHGQAVQFEDGPNLILRRGAWCPFNSQNTHWWEPAYDLLYLPSYCSFRMTDIWRSFVAQACLWANGWSLAFCGPTVYQVRNEHDLLKDFENEIPGYLHNQKIVEALGTLPLREGRDQIQGNMWQCYGALVAIGVVPAQELNLLEAWFSDLARARKDVSA